MCSSDLISWACFVGFSDAHDIGEHKMKFCLYAEKLSPHLLPLVAEMVSVLGEHEVRYIFRGTMDLVQSGYALGWEEKVPAWVINRKNQPEEAERWLRGCDMLVCELRELELWEYRAKCGKGMFYTSERWFKPQKILRIFSRTLYLPGWVRLLHPSYFRMARRACKLFKKYDNIIYLANGVYAANDFARLLGFMSGKVLSLTRGEIIDCEHRPGGRVWSRNDEQSINDILSRFRIWGYFVKPSDADNGSGSNRSGGLNEVKCLWVGRLLDWKRVDTLVRAVGECQARRHANPQLPKVTVDVYGAGPEERRLKKMANKNTESIRFFPPVPMGEVRTLMKNHDMYILPSNAWEGWGAVVNEALEEGMVVIGSYEAGACRVMLPESNLFRAGDWRGLMNLMISKINRVMIGEWSVANACKTLMGLLDK